MHLPCNDYSLWSACFIYIHKKQKCLFFIIKLVASTDLFSRHLSTGEKHLVLCFRPDHSTALKTIPSTAPQNEHLGFFRFMCSGTIHVHIQ